MVERSYPLADNEAARLAELHQYRVLDSVPEAIFNDTVALARSLLDVATSVVSLVDDERQWFKAKSGIDACETSRGRRVLHLCHTPGRRHGRAGHASG